jgi:hypothetical protein
MFILDWEKLYGTMLVFEDVRLVMVAMLTAVDGYGKRRQ